MHFSTSNPCFPLIQKYYMAAWWNGFVSESKIFDFLSHAFLSTKSSKM
jgi:hypothetical protein